MKRLAAFLAFVVLACGKPAPQRPQPAATPTAAAESSTPDEEQGVVDNPMTQEERDAITQSMTKEEQEAMDRAMDRVLALADVGERAPESDMSKRTPSADLARIAKKDRTVSGAGRGSRGDGRMGTGQGSVTPKVIDKGRITVTSKKALTSTTLTVDAVIAKIQSAHMAGVQDCYKAALQQNPAAKGAMKLEVRVTEVGRGWKAKVSSFDKSLDACVERQMSVWRFPIPKAGDGVAVEASFEIVLQLVPE